MSQKGGTMVYRGRVRNGVVVLDPDIRLPDGIEVRIEPVSAPPRKTLAEQLGDLVGSVSDLPPDMAQQHDHYLHGAPKR
jgi:hypothetical protein